MASKLNVLETKPIFEYTKVREEVKVVSIHGDTDTECFATIYEMFVAHRTPMTTVQYTLPSKVSSEFIKWVRVNKGRDSLSRMLNLRIFKGL